MVQQLERQVQGLESDLAAARAAGGRIIPVGTTALRLIESAAQEDGTLRPFEGTTDIFIYPGYRFRVTDGLMTNFHLPKSTLLMLVSAFAGYDTMRAAYRHAPEAGARGTEDRWQAEKPEWNAEVEAAEQALAAG